MGIEPTLSAWEAEVLPLNYTRGCSEASAILSESPGRRKEIAGIWCCGRRRLQLLVNSIRMTAIDLFGTLGWTRTEQPHLECPSQLPLGKSFLDGMVPCEACL